MKGYYLIGVELLLGKSFDDGGLAHRTATQEDYFVFNIAQFGALVEHLFLICYWGIISSNPSFTQIRDLAMGGKLLKINWRGWRSGWGRAGC
jgi:hypothetical protein